MKSEHSLLSIESLTKSFFGVPVLRGISLTISGGETLGLVGENGAGKSTLMNLLGGNLQPDAGTMRLEGKEYQPRDAGEATAAGIAFIHQELNLFPNLSVPENIFLTAFPKAGPIIRRSQLHRQTRSLLEQVGLDLEPKITVEHLSAGERQLVEIAKALNLEARIIIFDEPTTSLSHRETEHLFTLIERLQQRGVARSCLDRRRWWRAAGTRWV